MAFTEYQKTADSPTVYGTTDQGQKVAFENEQQFTQSGGNFANVKTVNTPITDAIPFTQFSLSKASTTIPAQTVANPITGGDINALLAENKKNYEARLASLVPSAAEKASSDRLLALQQDQQKRIEQVQERPLDGTILTGGVNREISDIANGATRESLVNLRQQTFEAQNLANLQKNRELTLQQLQLENEQGQFNINLAMKFNDQVKQEAQAAKDMIVKSGITTRFGTINGTVYDSLTGKPMTLAEYQQATGQQVGLPSSQTDFSQTSDVSSALNSLNGKTQIVSLGGREVAVTLDAKGNVVNRVDLGASPAKSGSDSTVYKFDASDRSRLLSIGLTSDQIANLQSDINNYGLDAAIGDGSGFSDSQRQAVKSILSGLTPTQEADLKQFLTPDWFKATYGEDALGKAAKDAGYRTSGKLWGGIGAAPKIDEYLNNSLMPLVIQYRNAGFTDQQILEKMGPKK